MKIHAPKVKPNRHGGFHTGTLCGRLSNRCDDGINSASSDAEVTCKFCLRLMKTTPPPTAKAREE